MSRSFLGSVLALAGLVSVYSCSESSTDEAFSGDLSDPQGFEAAVRQTFVDGTDGVLDAFERLLVATGGGAQDGVVITPTGTGANVALSVDFNGDGTRESTLGISVTGDIQTGAQVFLASITAPQVPSLVGGGGATITETSSGVILVESLYGNASADPPGSGNAADFYVSGDISVDLMTGNPSGALVAEIGTEEDYVYVTVSFESDGSGGFRIRFSGAEIDFTVP
jgi:hypothetical protein